MAVADIAGKPPEPVALLLPALTVTMMAPVGATLPVMVKGSRRRWPVRRWQCGSGSDSRGRSRPFP